MPRTKEPDTPQEPSLVSAVEVAAESSTERALRPKLLESYAGQPKVKEQLEIFIQAARGRQEPLDHTLLYGPPGLGKTTLAQIIANEMQSNIKITSGPVLERPGDLAAILTSLAPGDVLFIDEIHRLPAVVEEILYPAMEDFRLDIFVGEGPQARSVQIPLPPFTLVGATTRAGSLSAPLRDRFGITCRLEYYSDEDLQRIVQRSAGLLGAAMDEDAALEVARRSRGTPRIANRLLRRVRDFAEVRGTAGLVSKTLANDALLSLGVDQAGLDESDRRILGAIVNFYNGGPVGLDTLAANCGEDSGTIEDAIEPYLLQRGLIARTPRGRVITASGRAHVGAAAHG